MHVRGHRRKKIARGRLDTSVAARLYPGHLYAEDPRGVGGVDLLGDYLLQKIPMLGTKKKNRFRLRRQVVSKWEEFHGLEGTGVGPQIGFS